MHDLEQHFRLIERTVLAGPNKTDATWRTASWARCLQDYKLNPSSTGLVCLTSREVREEIEIYGENLSLAEAELESTLSMIEGGGYSAHIANRNGIIIAERQSKDSTYNCSLDRVGAVWSEEIGGTNGIGTSLRDLRPTTVYLTDHFYANLTGEACASAPFFDPYGEILGIVNLSTRNPGVPQLAHRVVFGVAQATADRLETAYFRNLFHDFHTLAVTADHLSSAIFAVDSDFRIVGATRSARRHFKIDDSAIGARSLWAIFEKVRGNPSLDQLAERPRELRHLETGAAVTVALRRPVSAKHTVPTQKQPASKLSPRPKGGRRAITLAECAGSDPQMKRNIRILQKVSGTGLHLLLLGETGAGKDTLARALHIEGSRASGPYVAFNCSAVPESLIDSELFGYSAGAFTGASKDGNSGRIVEADKGTLFLDEIGDMPVHLQTRFLRFLETQEVMPLGGGKPRHVDVQIIAATHQDLQAKVAAGTFRQDLFYRLAGTVVTLPALRERTDLREIIANLLAMVSEGAPVPISDPAMRQLLSYSWPGNVRELRNVLTRAARLAEKVIQPDDLMLTPAYSASHAPFSTLRDVPGRDEPPASVSSKQASDIAVRDAIFAVIGRHGSDAIACSKALGISRATLYRKLRQYGLSLTDN